MCFQSNEIRKYFFLFLFIKLQFILVYLILNYDLTTTIFYVNKSDAKQNETFETKILNCRKFSDLTEYCLYENVCLENNIFLFLTSNAQLFNKTFEYNGHLGEWIHLEAVGSDQKPFSKPPNNPLPLRAFLNGKYVDQSIWNNSTVHHDGCHTILNFDSPNQNVFHWSIKISPIFIYQHYNKYNEDCKRFKSIRIVNRGSRDLSDWQKNFLEISTDMRPGETEIDFMHDKKDRPVLQCYKRLLVPGTAVYVFTGPTEAIDFRQKTAQRLNITYELKRVVIVKRTNRIIVNQNELDEFVKSKFGESIVDIVYLENLNFSQQVRLMSKANLLISVHGAGLTNAIFLPSTASVIEILSPHFLYPLYEKITTQSGHFFFRFMSDYNSTIHSAHYANITARQCFKSGGCIVHWRDSRYYINMTKFSYLIDQVMETF